MSTVAPKTVATSPAGRPSAARRSPWLHPAAKPLLFIVCCLPLLYLIWAATQDQLGANPAEALIRRLGDWALRGLCLTLSITPLRFISKQPALLRFRRMLGLFSFAYGSLHLAAYAWLDMGLEFADIAHDIAKRPFILMGFAAWALMLPLAATSFNRAIKALGGKRWQWLHKLVYAVIVIALLHFIWMRAGKNNFAEPAVYGAVIALLLGWRLLTAIRQRRAS
ncbi:protein-methionine-sulfoxide reductase heme-binding subunit MsrQ [Paucibacter sp. APW11]|uniref:Protein-methionine-sulfoxide reductase heme-binding subunit MsrQ n=1 Tax=Roseateles aquae TaxID=3077235 RepID=A0ABU3PDG0_9BURK|nr:protein-methionine-sulfoxide reductase heme-binding subunit MsrQ [Paucibacter sp. APW11]MDT9000595.1 protein-methionine-sulfoxide reductase heme-binding subunit MsrQ [Paucibacter sp. APW11]